MKSARKFLIKYFEVSDEYLEETDSGKYSACDTYIANSLYDDIANGDIDEILLIMKKFAKYKLKNRSIVEPKLTGDSHIDQLIQMGR